MPRLPGFRRSIRLPWRSPQRVAADFDEELRFHLDMRVAELVSVHGLDPDVARAQALREFGDADDARRYIVATDRAAEAKTRRREDLLNLWQDLVHAGRGLRRNPGFTAAVILVLALGIGATTAIFTLVNAVLLRPLPLPDADRLVGFGNPALVREISEGSPRTDLFSFDMYRDLRDRTRLVPDLLASGTTPRLDVVIPDPSGARPIETAEHPRARLVSGNYFDVLGVRARLGRTFTQQEDVAPGSGPVVVISHAYWQRRFDRDPSAVGRTLIVGGTPLTIIGVTPEGFFGEIMDSQMDLWIPLTMQPLVLPGQNWLRDRGTSWLLMMGRPRQGVAPEQAQAEFTNLARQALGEVEEGSTAADYQEWSVSAYEASRGFSSMRSRLAEPLAILMGLSGLVLLIVCANVANLMLARVAGRRREVSVRLALGAGRLRVMRHLLAESVLLGAGAGICAILVLQLGSTFLLARARSSGAINLDVSLDARVFAFAAALSLLTAVVLGFVPAARATGVAIASALRAQGRGTQGDPLGDGRRIGLGKALVVGQVALSLVLLASAGLLYRSVSNLQQRDLGAARDELLLVRVDAHPTGYSSERLHALYADVAERLRRVPGVRGVTFSQNGIFSGTESTTSVSVPGYVSRSEGDGSANTDWVGPHYFRTIGAQLIRGRGIEPRDDARAAPVAVINETMASHYFSERDAIGETLRVDSERYTIVGVVADVESQSLRGAPGRRYYTPYLQREAGGTLVFEVRTDGAPEEYVDIVRRETAAADPALSVMRVAPLTALMRHSIEGELVVAGLATAAGALALALAALGLYGVMTYTIIGRTSEFGLRMALGAAPSDVARMVLRETMGLVAMGVVIGIPAALGAARLLRNQLVGVGMVDFRTLALALVCLAASAALAGFRPARRAGQVAPQVSLAED